MFSVSADPRTGFPVTPHSKIHIFLLLSFSVLITVSCDEDVDEAGEDEVEELVNRPRNNEFPSERTASVSSRASPSRISPIL